MSFKKNILTAAIILSSVSAFTQYKVSGTVSDMATKSSIIGVAVSLPDLKIGTLTNENGFFEIPNLKKGTYLISFSYLGYKSYYTKIDLQKDTIMSVSLESSATELGGVVITGVTRATELKHNPIVVSTIDKNAFNQNSASNLIDALKEVPGVAQLTTGPNISKPVIRGLGYNRIISLNNGIKHEGQQWGDEHGIEIDEYAIDRVEIIKGPGSLIYGSDGIGGVLNFLPEKPPLDGQIKTQFLTNYQSNNNLLAYSIANSGNKNGFHWNGRITNKYAGNYSNQYDGKVYNSAYTEIDGQLSLGLIKNWGYTNLILNSYNTKLGLVEGDRDSLGNFIYEDEQGNEVTATKLDLKSYKIGIPYQKINHLGIISNSYFILKKGTINADLAFQNNKRREFEEVKNPDETGLFFSLNTVNYNLCYNLENINGWETSVGIGGMQQSNKNKGEQHLIPDYNLFDIGAFAYTQKTFNKISLAGGFRFDNRYIHTQELFLDTNGQAVAVPDATSEMKFSQFQRIFNGASGSIGISYQTSRYTTLKLNFSNGFRAPNIAELSSNGNHEGTFRYELGNVNLKPEFSHQIDLAYYINSPHINLQISPFVNFIDNYIFIKKLKDANGNDIYPDPSVPSPAFQYTSGNARLLGGELYLDIHPHPIDWLHIENAFSFVQAQQNHQSDSTKYLPFIPAPHYRGGLKAEFKDLNKNISNFYLRFNIDQYFAQNKIYSAYETETSTPGYTLLSAGLGISLKAFKKSDFISFYVSGENLTNLAYQNHLSRLKNAPENELTGRYGVFNMGRNVNIKIILDL